VEFKKLDYLFKEWSIWQRGGFRAGSKAQRTEAERKVLEDD
jgi:hypothetical protein